MLNEGTKFFVEKYKKTFEEASGVVHGYVSKKQHGVDIKTIVGTDKFPNYCYEFARSIYKKGILPSPVYAACVASVLTELGVDYKAYISHSLCDKIAGYDKSLKAYENKKADKPVIGNHVYIQAGDHCYEYFSGYFDGIKHLESEIIM